MREGYRRAGHRCGAAGDASTDAGDCSQESPWHDSFSVPSGCDFEVALLNLEDRLGAAHLQSAPLHGTCKTNPARSGLTLALVRRRGFIRGGPGASRFSATHPCGIGAWVESGRHRAAAFHALSHGHDRGGAGQRDRARRAGTGIIPGRRYVGAKQPAVEPGDGRMGKVSNRR